MKVTNVHTEEEFFAMVNSWWRRADWLSEIADDFNTPDEKRQQALRLYATMVKRIMSNTPKDFGINLT